MYRLTSALETARLTRSKKAKVEALAHALRAVQTSTPDELPTAARLLLGELLPPSDTRTLGVGWALLRDVVLQLTGADASALRAGIAAAGDMGDGVAPLFEGNTEAEGVSLARAGQAFEALAATLERGRKHQLLAELFAVARPLEAKYLTRALLGELRIGVQRGLLEEAIAVAFGHTLPAVRKASALVADVGALAQLAAQQRLGEARIEAGAPLAFMLASPDESVKTPLPVARAVAEDKLDGVRCQVHVEGGRVWLFARGQGAVTQSFPEVVEALRAAPGLLVLDGEVIAVHDDGTVRPFQALQARLGRVAPGPALQREVKVMLVLYDVMVERSENLLALPFHARRARLEALAPTLGPTVRLNPLHALDATQDLGPQLDALFEAARARGNEGLVLKELDAPYEAGRRGSAWRKVKRAFATLDVVVTAAQRGYGKRAGLLSDLTFAVWKDGVLLDVGKAYSGLTDAEIATTTARFEAQTLEQRGGWHRVQPSLVLEVGFDGLQRSTRHPSGFALRFPRILRIRDDKPAAEADTLATVEALFERQVASGHREEPAVAAPKSASKTQLDLF